MKRLEGKTAVVTGAAGGLGFAITEAFLKEDATVIAICHNNRGRLDELKNERLHIYHMDICNAKSVELSANKIREKVGDIDILVNNAGISHSDLFFSMEDEVWDSVIQTSLYGARNVTKQFLFSMLRKKQGSIIQMSSVNGLVGNIGQSNYCAAKAGLIGMTKALSKEVAKKNIRVNAIAPGYIDTEMVSTIKEKQQELLKKTIPMQRFGKPEEVANLAVFLASDEASYITGQTFVIDGGLTA